MKASSLNNQRSSTPSRGNGELILVVDSDKSVLEMASIVFDLGGYRTITANHSMLAFEIYEKRSKNVELVLLDATMPVMDSVALSQILVEINPMVKIIVSSRQQDTDNELELRKIGVKHVIPKPYNVSQLLKVVYNVIHGKDPEAP